jgi:hypothetical protein
MIANQGQAASAVQVLAPASRTAGANNSGYFDCNPYEGDVVFLCEAGAVTGSVDFKVQDATDSGGTAVADMAGFSITGLAANTSGKIVVPARQIRSHARVVCTVTTGPALCAVSLMSHPKYV